MVFDKEILGVATTFIYAAKTLEQQMNSITKGNIVMNCSLFVPYAANSAFACELILKSMINPPQIPQKHNLDVLFNLLDVTDRNKIETEVRKQLSNNGKEISHKDFVKKIVTHSKAFEEWRYAYDFTNCSEKKYDKDFMDTFMDCSIEYAVSQSKK